MGTVSDGPHLHDKATRGEALSPEERVCLDTWYAEQDAAEAVVLADPAEHQTIAALRSSAAGSDRSPVVEAVRAARGGIGMAIMQVRKRGQVTLPQAIRDAYHLDDGSELEVTPLDATRFEVRVLPPQDDLLALLDEFAGEGPVPDLDAERQALAAALRSGDRP